MPTQTVNLTLQQDITRVALQALISGSTVIPKRTYRITDAIGPTSEIILVKGLTTNTITGYAINETTNEWGTYNIGTDVFTVQFGDFIPLSGTISGEPVTGAIEMDGSLFVEFFQINGDIRKYIRFQDDNSFSIGSFDASTGFQKFIDLASADMAISSDDPAFVGLVYAADYSANYALRSLVDKEYVDSLIPQQVATEVTLNSHGFAVGDWLYLNGSTWTKAIATSEAESNVLGVVSEVIDVNNFVLTNVGYVSTLSGLGASGLVFYLSPTTAGAMTTTKPTTVGQVIRKLFISQTNNAGWVLQEHFEQVERTVRVSGSNVTTTSATESVVTGLTIPVVANALYKGRVTLRIGCDNTGGVRFGFNFPALATLLAGYVGNSTATTAQQMFSGVLTSGVSATTAFNTLNAQSGYVVIDFTLETGVNAGDVELIVRSGTAGQTSTIYTNFSNMELRRIDI